MKRQSGIIADVTRTTEAIDFDAWAQAYVAALLDARRAPKQEAA
jgi:hypothetical protein